jgi:hypothetical protein
MKKKILLNVALILAFCLLLGDAAFAEVNTTAGAYFRLRQETWENLFDMNRSDTTANTPVFTRPDDNYFRLKSSLWLKSELDKQYTFFVKLTNEARYFMESSDTRTFKRPLGLNWDEIVFDNLYAGAKDVAGLPVDLTVGRQDFLMTYGEGFLIMDGTPEDGSRTFYFDAARAVARLGALWSVDFVYISNQKYDSALPSLYDHHVGKRQLNTTDDEGFVIYGKGKLGENLGVEPYYMYKREKATPTPFAEGANSSLALNTVGARAVYGFGTGWKLRGEFAHQFGEYNGGDKRTGDGGYAFISRKYEDIALKPSFEIGVAYLSGDKPGTTNKVEAWDPLYSRWPWLSELYILSLAPETGVVAYWTNLQAYRADFKLALDDASVLDLAYNFLRANENSHVAGAPPIFSANGKDRGHLIQAKLSHDFSKSLNGYFLLEDFVPGNYYTSTNRDNAMFVRWELQWKI